MSGGLAVVGGLQTGRRQVQRLLGGGGGAPLWRLVTRRPPEAWGGGRRQPLSGGFYITRSHPLVVFIRPPISLVINNQGSKSLPALFVRSLCVLAIMSGIGWRGEKLWRSRNATDITNITYTHTHYLVKLMDSFQR